MQSYLFQECISLNPRRVEQNYMFNKMLVIVFIVDFYFLKSGKIYEQLESRDHKIIYLK